MSMNPLLSPRRDEATRSQSCVEHCTPVSSAFYPVHLAWRPRLTSMKPLNQLWNLCSAPPGVVVLSVGAGYVVSLYSPSPITVTVLSTSGIGYVVLFQVLFEMPKHYDRSNTTRQILKYKNIEFYLEKEKEYAKIVQRIGELARSRDPSTTEIGYCLNDLRNSPFYDAEGYKPMFKNLWKLHSQDVNSLRKDELHNPPCAKNQNPDYQCTKAMLIKDLYEALHNEDGLRE